MGYGAFVGRTECVQGHHASAGCGWAVRAMVRTVMSSAWGAPKPNARAASAMALADWALMAWVRSKPKSSRVVALVF